jgi:hypothetical protein
LPRASEAKMPNRHKTAKMAKAVRALVKKRG